MLLFLSSAYRAGAASGFSRNRAFKTIHFGTIFGAVGPLLILIIESGRVNLVTIGWNNSRLLNRGAYYWYRGAWNESAYALGVLIRMGVLVQKNSFEVGVLIREWALIGTKL